MPAVPWRGGRAAQVGRWVLRVLAPVGPGTAGRSRTVRPGTAPTGSDGPPTSPYPFVDAGPPPEWLAYVEDRDPRWFDVDVRLSPGAPAEPVPAEDSRTGVDAAGPDHEGQTAGRGPAGTVTGVDRGAPYRSGGRPVVHAQRHEPAAPLRAGDAEADLAARRTPSPGGVRPRVSVRPGRPADLGASGTGGLPR